MNGGGPSGAKAGERAHLDPPSVTASVPEVVIAQMKGDFKSLLKEIPSSPRLWSFKWEQAGPTRSFSNHYFWLGVSSLDPCSPWGFQRHCLRLSLLLPTYLT